MALRLLQMGDTGSDYSGHRQKGVDKGAKSATKGDHLS